MIELTSKIQDQFPYLDIDLISLDDLLEKYEVNTVNRVAGFFAQCAHESNNFKVKVENLNYSAESLNKVFPKYFKNAGRDANEYHRQPERIANVVYANRMGNGDESSGDGFRYRGRGYIQLTGKNNYQGFADSIDKSLEDTISYLETDEGCLESALWFWKTNNINRYCDSDDIITMSKRVNGGTHGLEDRSNKYSKYKQILS